MLNKLTVIIFSYNKHKELIRSIDYWSQLDLSVVILDGSDRKLNETFLLNKNVQYIHDPRSLYDRLMSSIKYIKTEYMVLCCDDVFYLPSALKSCINFLSEKPNYSCCGGLSVCFGKINETEFYGIEAYPKLRSHSIEQEDPLARAKKHFSNYEMAHLYSILRKKDWDVICKTVFEKEYNLFAAFELQIEFLVPISGKTKIINELFALKDQDPEPVRGTSPSMNLSSSKLNWWLEDNKEKERNDFFIRMNKASKELVNDEIINFNEEKIFQIFKIYFDSINSIKSKVARYAPKNLKIFLRFLLQIIKREKKINKSKSQKNLTVMINELEDDGIIINHEDIKNIFTVINKSNLN